MTAGLLTPCASAAHVGLMTVAARTDHRGKGFFVFAGGWEYVAIVGLVAVSLAGLGPGKWSSDHALQLHLYGLGWAGAAAGAGLAGAAALLLVARERASREAT